MYMYIHTYICMHNIMLCYVMTPSMCSRRPRRPASRLKWMVGDLRAV